MPIFLKNTNNIWPTISEEPYKLYAAGREKAIAEIRSFIGKETSFEDVAEKLKNVKGFFAFIYEDDDRIIAATDHIRSFQVFYYGDKISDSAYLLQKEFNLVEVDDNSSIEFVMSGYVTGSRTLLKPIKALQPGEIICVNKETGVCNIKRYYRYRPCEDNRDNTEKKAEELNRILDRITEDIIVRASGRPICLPLSAGLDSRIILCKLHEHGYSKVKTFSYGPKFNFEAKHAKRIAETLGYEWRHVIPPGKWARAAYDDEERKRFWEYACEFKSIPCMREYGAIRYMHEKGLIEEGAIIINGQSGDFISGGHIPSSLITNSATKDAFFHELIEKHYDLWRNFKGNDDIALVKGLIGNILADIEDGDLYSLYETWEYECRQVLLVINGQRIYEYLGYDWELPLWERELVDFYENIPVEDKINQRLYKEFLKIYNYKGLFPEKEPEIWRWPANMLWAIPAAKIVEFVFGKEAKENFYSYMKYYGHYSNQYKMIGIGFHRQNYKNIRNIVSLHVRRWIEENPEFVSDAVANRLLSS